MKLIKLNLHLVAQNGSTIGTYNTQPTATVATSTTAGGEIRA